MPQRRDCRIDAAAMSAGAEFKVGNASYIRYFHEGDTYVSIAGHSFKDKDQTWKVKVDKKTGRRFYVNLGKHGRSWTLPDTRDKAGLPEGAPGAATPSPAAPSDHASATPHSAPRHMGRAGSSNRLKRVPSPAASPVHEQGRGTGVAATPADPRTPEKNINESISLLEVYKLRTPFNPTEAVANAEVSLPLIEGVAGELERVSDELRLTPEGVLSVVLSALHYLRVKPLADPASTVQKLCYAVASDSKADALSSPFLEVQSKIDYLVSINESMNTSISEQSFDLSVIRTNIELRERERDKAAAKLSEWKSKCSDADGEVDEASEESHRTTRLVEAHLANIRTVTQMLRTAFPSDAQACLAHVEKLKAELQEACNSARSLGDSYKRVKALRGTLHRKLESMSRCDEPNEQQQAHVIESLRAELARQKDDNAKLLLKLSKASIESEQGPQQGRDELRTAKAAVRTLQEVLPSTSNERTRKVEGGLKNILPQHRPTHPSIHPQESTALRTKCKKLEAHIIETRCHETSDSRVCIHETSTSPMQHNKQKYNNSLLVQASRARLWTAGFPRSPETGKRCSTSSTSSAGWWRRLPRRTRTRRTACSRHAWSASAWPPPSRKYASSGRRLRI